MKLARLGMPLDERPVQRGALDLLARHGFDAIHVPNGTHLSGDSRARSMQMRALERDGPSAGFPDLIVFGKAPGRIGFLECKRENCGVVSPHQIAWRVRLMVLGWPWRLVCLPEDVYADLGRPLLAVRAPAFECQLHPEAVASPRTRVAHRLRALTSGEACLGVRPKPAVRHAS